MNVSSWFHDQAALLPENSHRTHWMGGWVGLRTNMDSVQKRKIPCTYRE